MRSKIRLTPSVFLDNGPAANCRAYDGRQCWRFQYAFGDLAWSGYLYDDAFASVQERVREALRAADDAGAVVLEAWCDTPGAEAGTVIGAGGMVITVGRADRWRPQWQTEVDRAARN